MTLTLPVPTTLPGLSRDAVKNGFDVNIRHEHFSRLVVAVFASADVVVELVWHTDSGTPRLRHAMIDGRHAPYRVATARVREAQKA